MERGKDGEADKGGGAVGITTPDGYKPVAQYMYVGTDTYSSWSTYLYSTYKPVAQYICRY
jgi:hypothetical protein